MKKYKQTRIEEKKERTKALKKIAANYNNDPAYWMDVLNSNSRKEIKKLAYERLIVLGWKVERIGKKKS